MKERLIDTLVSFSNEESITTPPVMMVYVSEEIGLNLQEIQKRSQRILQHLLHNYAAFSVETIDKFNHRLIRTFAHDLKLAQSFEVSLETDLLLEEAVDSLLSKTGQNKQITEIILDFALQKTDDDKSWDVSRDIAEASKLLFLETEADEVSTLKSKTLEDFSEFTKQLNSRKKYLELKIKEIADDLLQKFKENGIEKSHLSRGYPWVHFEKLSEVQKDISFGNGWQNDLGTKPLYPTRVKGEEAAIIDGLTPFYISCFHETKTLYFDLSLINNILKNITPLSVINLVSQEIETIKAERNLLPISEFNFLINQEIKNQPAPFIYERLGEKYRHFFIDEFQDTSRMQWENLVPLIDNALSQKTNDISGSLLLVGDAKQSIYRWRGGLPEQFMELYDKKNPFPSQKKNVLSLGTNYRSHEEIIDFNNQFFTFVSNYFDDPIHKNLYVSGNDQKFNPKKEGYVKLEFIEKQSKALNLEVYSEKVHQTILEVLDKGYSPNDICILTRKKADGIFLGSYLLEQGIPVISSETLLLKTSANVQILLYVLMLALYPKNEEAKIHLLDRLHDHWKIQDKKHDFFLKFLGNTEDHFTKALNEYGIAFNLNHFSGLSLYEAFEYAIRAFKLSKSADAYLFGFMDLVFEFSSQSMADKALFMEYWETKKDSASIPASEGADAVQLMTIHKSKGLEFPVVIFPFADIQLYDARFDTLWYPLDEEKFNFSEALINFKGEVENYGPIGEKLFRQHRSKLELDNLNLLYVTLTRAARSEE